MIHIPYPNQYQMRKYYSEILPQYVSYNAILEFLNDHPGIHVKSGIIFSRLRDSENTLTPYCSGDRFVYVRGNMSQAIYSTALIEHNKCRVWHKSQETACARCRNLITPPQTPIGVMHLKKTMMQSSSDLRHT